MKSLPIILLVVCLSCADNTTGPQNVVNPANDSPLAGTWTGKTDSIMIGYETYAFTLTFRDIRHIERDSVYKFVATITGHDAIWECNGSLGYYAEPAEIGFASDPAGRGDAVHHWYMLFIGSHFGNSIKGTILIRDANFVEFFNHGITFYPS